MKIWLALIQIHAANKNYTLTLWLCLWTASFKKTILMGEDCGEEWTSSL